LGLTDSSDDPTMAYQPPGKPPYTLQGYLTRSPGPLVGSLFVICRVTLHVCREDRRETYTKNPQNTKNMSGLHSKCRGSPVAHAYPYGDKYLFVHRWCRSGWPSRQTSPATPHRTPQRL